MIKRNIGYIASSALLLGISTACVSQAIAVTIASNPTVKPTNSLTAQTSNLAPKSPSRPPTKTIKDEWTQKNLTLKLYDKKGFPFSTYFLDTDFITEEASSGEGRAAWFYSKVNGKKDKLAYVNLFFPAKPLTLEQMKKTVTGKRGLLEINKWKGKKRTDKAQFSWAKEVIDFEKPFNSQNNIMGTIYMGEYKGKAFRAIVHYPADAGDGFAPRASLILKDLQLRN